MIRLAVETDIAYLADIERAAASLFQTVGLADLFGSQTVDETILREAVGEGRLWVAVIDDRPVGFALASAFDGHGHLDELDVHPDYGRRGIGAALVETVCEWAKARGFDAVTLSTQTNVPWNAPFYARLGFEVFPPEQWTPTYHDLRRREEALGLPTQDRVFMIRKLG